MFLSILLLLSLIAQWVRMSRGSYDEEQTCQLNYLDGVFPLSQHLEKNILVGKIQGINRVKLPLMHRSLVQIVAA